MIPSITTRSTYSEFVYDGVVFGGSNADWTVRLSGTNILTYATDIFGPPSYQYGTYDSRFYSGRNTNRIYYKTSAAGGWSSVAMAAGNRARNCHGTGSGLFIYSDNTASGDKEIWNYDGSLTLEVALPAVVNWMSSDSDLLIVGLADGKIYKRVL